MFERFFGAILLHVKVRFCQITDVFACWKKMKHLKIVFQAVPDNNFVLQ